VSESAEAAAAVIRTRKGDAPQELVIGDLEAALVRAGCTPLGTGRSHPPVVDGALRGLARLGALRPLSASGPVAVAGLMGCEERQLVPYGLRGRTALYVWDCWPTATSRWASFFRRWRPAAVYLSCQEASRFWAARLPGTAVSWAPEAIDATAYPPGPSLRDRSTVLLELGRRHTAFHERSRRHLAARGARHLFSAPDRQFVFSGRPGLVAGLHDAVASACFPGSRADPAGRTGTWATMTHRYLEAVATRTRVVGHVPAEMTELFGFRPGVDVDPQRPEELLDALVTEPERFQPLVDRAYRRLLQVATWDVRVAQLLATLPR